MKKLLIFILLSSSLIYSDAKAQFIDMSIGIRGGLSLASYSREVNFGTSILDESSIPSGNIGRVTAGLTFNVKLASLFGMQVEGMFVNKGGSYDANTFSGTNLTPVEREYLVNLDYLQFAIIPKLVLDQTPVFGFFGGVGVYGAFLTSAKERINQNTFQQSLAQERDISNSIAPNDFGVIFSGGMNISKVSIEARYSFGFINLIDDPTLSDNITAKNGVISFLIGYNFSLL